MSHREAKEERGKFKALVKKSTSAEELLVYFRRGHQEWAKFDRMFWESMYKMLEILGARYKDQWTGEGYYDPD